MNMRKRTWRRRLAFLALTLPLLEATGVQITERSLINGFFDAVTPFAADRLAERAAAFFEQYVTDP